MSDIQSHQDAVEAVKVSLDASPEAVEDAEATAEDEVVIEATGEEAVELESTSDDEVIETDDSPAIDAPNSWSKEDKEHFSTLPRDAQTRIANRERDRDLTLRQSQDQNVAKSKELDSELEAVRKQKVDLISRLKAGNPEPSTDMLDPEHESHNPDAYHLAVAKRKEGLEEVEKLQGELDTADANDLKDWQQKEVEVYKDIFPQYVDPEKGQDLRNTLAEYACTVFPCYTMEDAARIFPTTPAAEMLILQKARLYDAARAKQRKAKKKPKAKQLAGGNSNPSKPKVTDIKAAAAKYAQNPNAANAAALLEVNQKKA